MTGALAAFDLGAESGRLIRGDFSPDGIALREIHRFNHRSLPLPNGRTWNIPGLLDELMNGLRQWKNEFNSGPVSLSIDSWGVDYLYLSQSSDALGWGYCYRDDRTDKFFEELTRDPGAEFLYANSGIQLMAINTLFQLVEDSRNRPKQVHAADSFLLVADYLHYLLTGVARQEESLASTTGLYHAAERAWSQPLIQQLGLRPEIFPEVVPSGTRLGSLRPELAAEFGLDSSMEIIAGCSHDTAAAFLGTPLNPGRPGAILSSGTWSLLGLELPKPILNEEARGANFTNELGWNGSVRFLKNLAGLWILQECRREWERSGQSFSYPELVELAEAAPDGFRSIIYPNYPEFLKPGNMPSKIQEFCRNSGQPVPEDPGAITRCILESLALLYRSTLENASRMAQQPVELLHLVGGGSRNELLNQLTADALGIPVEAGPEEATALGNLGAQALSLGWCSDVTAWRSLLRKSFPPTRWVPRERQGLDDAIRRFDDLATHTANPS